MSHGIIFVLSYFAWLGLIIFTLVGVGLTMLRGE